jgi:hypothetical protein
MIGKSLKNKDKRASSELLRAKVPLSIEEEAGGPQLHQPPAVEEGNLEGVAGEDRVVRPAEPGHLQAHQDAGSH